MSCGADEYKRFQMIDEYFSAGNKATVKELSDYLNLKNLVSHIDIKSGFSEKVLYKVLAAMKNELGAPIEKDSQNRFFYAAGKTLTKPKFLSNNETGKTVKLIQNLLETVKNSPVYEKAEKLCKEILEESEKKKNAGANRVIFLGAPASNVQDEIWSKIYEAMEENFHIVIEYQPAGSSKPVSRGVQPYQLVFDDGIWDLWGFDCVKRQRTIFNLSRIKSVEIRKDADKFNLPKDFDFLNMTPGTFGRFFDFNGKMTNYKIHLAKGSYAESLATERVWGKNFQTATDKTGTVLSFEGNQFLPVLRWILSWGADAEPLEPKKLVSAWKNEIKKMNSKSPVI